MRSRLQGFLGFFGPLFDRPPLSERDDHLRIKRDYEGPGRRVVDIKLLNSSRGDDTSHATYEVEVEIVTGETRRYQVSVATDSSGDRTLFRHRPKRAD